MKFQTKIFLLIFGLFLIGLIVYERPHYLGESINKKAPIYVTYHFRYDKTPEGYEFDRIQYTLTPGSKEYDGIVEMLPKYYYHHSIFNLFKNDVRGNDYYDIRYSDENGKIVWFGFSNRTDMKISNHYVNLGYFTDQLSEEFCTELDNLFNHTRKY